MHTSVTANLSAIVLCFFMVISSTVLISLTPSRKVLMILMSWMYKITFLALYKCFTYSQRFSSCFYLIVFRVSIVEGCSYMPWKFSMNMAHSWSQLYMVPSGKLMSHDLATSVDVMGR
jgi:hypothetical protein